MADARNRNTGSRESHIAVRSYAAVCLLVMNQPPSALTPRRDADFDRRVPFEQTCWTVFSCTQSYGKSGMMKWCFGQMSDRVIAWTSLSSDNDDDDNNDDDNIQPHALGRGPDALDPATGAAPCWQAGPTSAGVNHPGSTVWNLDWGLVRWELNRCRVAVCHAKVSRALFLSRDELLHTHTSKDGTTANYRILNRPSLVDVATPKTEIRFWWRSPLFFRFLRDGDN